MRVRVLGAGAGGGLPQWNCACPGCRCARQDAARAKARTQDSVAVSADGSRWIVLNASPDIRVQLASCDALWPRAERGAPMAAVVLTNADIDHCAGLLSLREGSALSVHATQSVRGAVLEGNSLCRALSSVAWHTLEPSRSDAIAGLSIRPFCVPGKPPLYLEGIAPPRDEDNVGLAVTDEENGRTLVYAPSVGGITQELMTELSSADCILLDGTFWDGDELVRAGFSTRCAADMAHVPISGAQGSLAALAELTRPRRVYTHVNNTNPILLEDSPERAAVTVAGWEVAWDGMEVRP